MEADFSGWATKYGLKCSDGRTIMPGAFQHQDNMRVPLVWQHGHTDPTNVLGHAILEARPDGVYARGFFNDSDKAKHAHGLLDHKDISHQSIFANQLVERNGRVLHGNIREVSLVLSGANPGAVIENVSVRHDDGELDVLEDEVVIHTGLELDLEDVTDNKEEVAHASGDGGSSDETISDVVDTMTDKQKNALYFMLQQAFESGDGTAQQDDLDDNKSDKEGTDKMSRNVFEQDKDAQKKEEKFELSHSDMEAVIQHGMRNGSLKAALEEHAISHGITNIDLLFPEAANLTNTPEFFKRRTEWVNMVLGGARKSPFSRIKTMAADLTFDEARAKGYIKGTLKKEEFFAVSRRITTPQTVYKKQKLDRDDIIDITDFDVVTWMKGEMRLMLDEELARAILLGDGRDVSDDDKIIETNIRPIATDDEIYSVVVNVNVDDASSSYMEVIEAVITYMQYYRGSGTPTFFTTASTIAKFKLLKDTLGRRIYRSLDEVASDMGVAAIVPVEVMESYPTIVGVIVNMNDYNIGADKGGQVTLFDDFDIDFNQNKYLIETRISGALTKFRSALVVKKVGSAVVLVTPQSPTFVASTGVVTIPTQTGVVYKNDVTNATLSAGAQSALSVGATLRVRAEPSGAGFAFPVSDDAVDEWSFTRPA